MVANSEIKLLAHKAGFDACGIAVPKPIPKEESKFETWVQNGKHGEMKYLEDHKRRAQDFWSRFPDAKSVIVLGVNYYSSSETPHPFFSPNGRGAGVRGRIARYAWGKDYHQVIPKRLKILESKIKDLTSNDIWFESCVDTKPIFERRAAQQAGLGFIGKQTQLLSLQFGPWLFLSELITNLELKPDEPHQGNCGTCRICIDECPTGAIEETMQIDARKCIAYLTIEHKSKIPELLRPKIENRVFGCDECLNVCPYAAKQKESDWSELKSESGFGSSIDIAKLFNISSQKEYEKKFEGTAILRAKRKQLLRNACVVLGNSKNPKAIPILEKALLDSSELVREHAAWAIQHLKQSAAN